MLIPKFEKSTFIAIFAIMLSIVGCRHKNLDEDKGGLAASVVNLAGAYFNYGAVVVEAGIGDAANIAAAGASPFVYGAGALKQEKTGSFQVHGNWCGPGHPNPTNWDRYKNIVNHPAHDEILNNDIDLRPVDVVDKLCMQHDKCYSENINSRDHKIKCDRLLWDELKWIVQFGEYSVRIQAIKVRTWVSGVLFVPR